jgi:hypothetical protein
MTYSVRKGWRGKETSRFNFTWFFFAAITTKINSE